MHINSRLRTFRNILQRYLDSHRGKKGVASTTAVMTVKRIISDFDKMFDPKILDKSTVKIHTFIEKYCYPWPNCPICGATMYSRTTKDKERKFYGCSKFPDCKGGRAHKEPHIPTINEALRLFLTEKQHEEKIKEQSLEGSRFHNLDIS